MQRKQDNKLKKKKQKELERSSQREIKGGENKQYQTSTSNYVIKVNHPKEAQQSQPQKTMMKPCRKQKFLNQDIEKSQYLHNARSLGTKKEITLKISTLDDLEDLNVYLKCKSSKKDCKDSRKERRNDKNRQNVKISNSAGNIKIRGVKSHSKSQKKLTFKYLQPKTISKSKSFTKCHQQVSKKQRKPSLKEPDYQTPEMAQIQNSYYFSNYDSKTPSKIEEDTSLNKKQDNLSVPNRKKGMFLFQSKEEEWREPKINVNLERTVDPYNW